MNRKAAFASFSIAIAVGFGALGAHYLKAELSTASLQSFETGVRYHLFHSIALLFLALSDYGRTFLKRYWLLMAVGMLLFSFSIYGLSTRTLFGAEGGWKLLGPVTPIGGLLLIFSWLGIGLAFLKNRGNEVQD